MSINLMKLTLELMIISIIFQVNMQFAEILDTVNINDVWVR